MIFFFFNDTATTEIYTLSLHDALPICAPAGTAFEELRPLAPLLAADEAGLLDRKSTRLNSSHGYISYAVFCLKKKKDPYKPIQCLPSPTSSLQSSHPISICS